MEALTFSGVDDLAHHSTRRLHRHHYRSSSLPAHENENEKRCGLNLCLAQRESPPLRSTWPLQVKSNRFSSKSPPEFSTQVAAEF